jgi:hypothetical protein
MEDARWRDLPERGILAQELQGLLRTGAVRLRAKIRKNLALLHGDGFEEARLAVHLNIQLGQFPATDPRSCSSQKMSRPGLNVPAHALGIELQACGRMRGLGKDESGGALAEDENDG